MFSTKKKVLKSSLRSLQHRKTIEIFFGAS